MIVQTYMVILTLSVGLISDVTCASFSNVFVESDVVPVGYYSYGIPYPEIENPRLSQINSLPAVPGYVTVHPAHAVTHRNHNPNVVTFHAPSAPIVIAPKQQEPTGYEYSYVVYDQNTGDHKAQRELSDGSVVRGEYSFLQPDGYVREVQYVADDVSGFNAVVKKFLPVAVEGNKKGTTNVHKESPPCHEIKSESLKEGSEEIHKNLHRSHSNEEVDEKSKKHTQHGTPKGNNNHSKPKESQEEENSKEKHHLKPKNSNEESDEKSKKHTQHNNNNHGKHMESQKEENSKEKHHLKPKHSNDESDEKSKENNDHSKSKESQEEETDEKSKENHHSKSKKISEENSSEESAEVNHKKCKDSAGKSEEKQNKKPKKESKESGEDSEQESESDESKEKYRKISSKETKESKEHNKEKTKKGSKESSGEDSGEESEETSHRKHKEVHELLKPSSEAALPYRDIIRCIEAAMRRNNRVPASIRQEHSPLTYIVLNKPC